MVWGLLVVGWCVGGRGLPKVRRAWSLLLWIWPGRRRFARRASARCVREGMTVHVFRAMACAVRGSCLLRSRSPQVVCGTDTVQFAFRRLRSGGRLVGSCHGGSRRRGRLNGRTVRRDRLSVGRGRRRRSTLRVGSRTRRRSHRGCCIGHRGGRFGLEGWNWSSHRIPA